MSRKLTATVVAFLIAAVMVTAALATPAVGSFVASLLARGTFTTAPDGSADGITLRTHGSTDHAVQTVTIGPGSSSGWHRHPGITLVTVKSGTLTRYNSNCVRDTFTAGQSFAEAGPNALVVRNETHENVVNYVTFIVPTGAALRIDMPNPGCAVE